LERRDGYRYWEKDKSGPPRRLQMLAQKVNKSGDQDGVNGTDQHCEAE
jgi:hypothetical protein